MEKKSYKELLNYYNLFLEKNLQKIRIINLNKSELVLSNGKKIIEYKQRVNFFNRCKSKIFGDKIDIIYGDESQINEEFLKNIKKQISSEAGKKCQNLHKENIKKNLNNGIPWNKGLKNDERIKIWNKGQTKNNNEVLKKFSEERTGIGNPMFGVKLSEDFKNKKSKLMKEKIISGEFTPNIHNSKTHWQIEFNGKKYRSSWEVVFQYLNPLCEYEKIRISYMLDGKEKIYITDFVDNQNHILYEIKPKEFLTNVKIKAKEKSAIEWCKQNGFIFKIISQEYFIKNLEFIRKSNLSNKIKTKMEKLYEISKKKFN